LYFFSRIGCCWLRKALALPPAEVVFGPAHAGFILLFPA